MIKVTRSNNVEVICTLSIEGDNGEAELAKCVLKEAKEFKAKGEQNYYAGEDEDEGICLLTHVGNYNTGSAIYFQKGDEAAIAALKRTLELVRDN